MAYHCIFILPFYLCDLFLLTTSVLIWTVGYFLVVWRLCSYFVNKTAPLAFLWLRWHAVFTPEERLLPRCSHQVATAHLRTVTVQLHHLVSLHNQFRNMSVCMQVLPPLFWCVAPAPADNWGHTRGCLTHLGPEPQCKGPAKGAQSHGQGLRCHHWS